MNSVHKHTRLPDGSEVWMQLDPGSPGWLVVIQGPEVKPLPLQPPRIQVEYRGQGWNESSAHLACVAANGLYLTEVERRVPKLRHALTAPRAPRVFSCIL